MKSALQIISWIGVIIGALAILGGLTEPTPDQAYTLVGGALFFLQGALALAYISEVSKTDWMR